VAPAHSCQQGQLLTVRHAPQVYYTCWLLRSSKQAQEEAGGTRSASYAVLPAELLRTSMSESWVCLAQATPLWPSNTQKSP